MNEDTLRQIIREELALAFESMSQPRQRATRLPADWALPRAWGVWAMSEQPSWTADHVRAQAATFKDYWCSKSGQGATKVDWAGTWRNWVRRAGPMTNAATGGQTSAVVTPAIEATRQLLASQELTPEQIAANAARAAEIRASLALVTKKVA